MVVVGIISLGACVTTAKPWVQRAERRRLATEAEEVRAAEEEERRAKEARAEAERKRRAAYCRATRDHHHRYRDGVCMECGATRQD